MIFYDGDHDGDDIVGEDIMMTIVMVMMMVVVVVVMTMIKRTELGTLSNKKKRYYLGIFPNMGGGSSQISKLL